MGWCFRPNSCPLWAGPEVSSRSWLGRVVHNYWPVSEPFSLSHREYFDKFASLLPRAFLMLSLHLFCVAVVRQRASLQGRTNSGDLVHRETGLDGTQFTGSLQEKGNPPVVGRRRLAGPCT